MNRSKRRGRPGPDAFNIKQIVREIERALNFEEKYKTNLIVANDQTYGEDALKARDGAARKMRFHKIWHELPCQVFLTSINLMDRFLTKLKVKSAYLDCVIISCLFVASDLHKHPIDLKRLLFITQVRCKETDVQRMTDIIKDKLGLRTGEMPITAFNYLNYFVSVLASAVKQLNVKVSFSTMIKKKDLLTQLEVVMLDSEVASMRPCLVALALIQLELERFLSGEIPNDSPCFSREMYQWISIIYELQIISGIPPKQFFGCYMKIKEVVENYDNNVRTSAPSHLKWRISSRINSLKPSENFLTNLNVIRE